MTIFNEAIELEARSYNKYDDVTGASSSTLIHPNGSLVCSGSAPFLASALRHMLAMGYDLPSLESQEGAA